jgi:hypothetical protein
MGFISSPFISTRGKNIPIYNLTESLKAKALSETSGIPAVSVGYEPHL